MMSYFGLSPASIISRPYTIITHMFVHADIIHFVGNIAMLSALGLVVENKIGSGKFLFIYLFSGLSAVPFALLIEALIGISVTLVGASGAIFGLMFVSGLISGWEKIPVVKVPLVIAISLFLLFTLILFIYNFPMSIGEFAHFGGLAGGIIGFLLVLPESKKK